MSDHNDCIDEFRAGDVVRAVVFAVDAVQEQLSVSFRRFRLPRESRSLELVGNEVNCCELRVLDAVVFLLWQLVCLPCGAM